MVALAFVLCFAACDARIDVYEQQDEDNRYFMVEFALSKTLENKLNNEAANVGNTDKKWTVAGWLSAYFDAISDRDFTAQYKEKLNENGESIYRYLVTVPIESDSKDVNEAFTLHGDMDVKTNLFLRTISVKRDDRFNYWLKEYKEAAARKAANTVDPADHHSMMGIVVSGRIDTYPQYARYDEEAERQGLTWGNVDGKEVYHTVVCPSFFEAFPSAGDYAELVLNNFWYASRKMNVACDEVIRAVDEYGDLDKKGAYYLFSKYAGDDPSLVEYEYFRADPTGWYIVATVCGALAVLIVIGVAKYSDAYKNKPKAPTVKEQFPYDPFGDDSIDPFA